MYICQHAVKLKAKDITNTGISSFEVKKENKTGILPFLKQVTK